MVFVSDILQIKDDVMWACIELLLCVRLVLLWTVVCQPTPHSQYLRQQAPLVREWSHRETDSINSRGTGHNTSLLLLELWGNCYWLWLYYRGWPAVHYCGCIIEGGLLTHGLLWLYYRGWHAMEAHYCKCIIEGGLLTHAMDRGSLLWLYYRGWPANTCNGGSLLWLHVV